MAEISYKELKNAYKKAKQDKSVAIRISIEQYKDFYKDMTGKQLEEPIIIDNPVFYYSDLPVFVDLSISGDTE